MKNSNKPLNKKELRKFGLITGAILASLFGLFFPWLFEHKYPLWPWIIAGILWLWALLLPTTLNMVYRVWMAIGHGLGWINSRIILGIMFFLIILPTSLILRLMGKDPMARTLDKSQTTYRVTSTNRTKDHVERPF